ncbi:MAG: D-alpha,beta-d-heptose 7-phosphate 1-kinase, d-beta-d-heptose 1-phosphate adenylyltransferase [Parcubacteria group bacterium]|nr:D-alpha,beta-d-heptose 7-phosphate 1-kinase, d-beta-d-heptose 1-phosphate adenylyltransferase [Parcubacteria group bacterium]
MNNDESVVYAGEHPLTEANPLHRRISRILKTTTNFSIPFEDRFVEDHAVLVMMLQMLRSMGCVIVFLTGVWDLFHIGHGDYIERGKEEARKLFPDAEHIIMVVGVDTDVLTRERKGDDRPVVPQDERARVLRHLRSVDIITLQFELAQLYGVVTPDVQIVSTSTKDLPAGMEVIRANCTHLVNLPPQAETSSTARIRRLTFEGAAGMLIKVEHVLSTALKAIRDELK